MRRTIFIIIIICLSDSAAFAQDKIHFLDSRVVDAVVDEVGNELICYRAYHNQNGPLYSVPVSHVDKIVYHNGYEQVIRGGMLYLGSHSYYGHMQADYVAIAAEARDYSHSVGYYKLRSNHSITTTLLGLEYSFEGVVSDRWTLIGRAGLVPTGFALYCSPDATGFKGYMGLGASFEARYYSSIKRRTNWGKDTYNNSSDFISLRLRANTYDGGPEVSITPAYGFRRAIGKHWVQEFTLGFRLGVNSDSGFFAPHAQYRIGFVF